MQTVTPSKLNLPEPWFSGTNAEEIVHMSPYDLTHKPSHSPHLKNKINGKQKIYKRKQGNIYYLLHDVHIRHVNSNILFFWGTV